jgi:hypothetical protein
VGAIIEVDGDGLEGTPEMRLASAARPADRVPWYDAVVGGPALRRSPCRVGNRLFTDLLPYGAAALSGRFDPPARRRAQCP